MKNRYEILKRRNIFGDKREISWYERFEKEPHMLLEIKDDFDLRKIALSGQCFRVKRFEDGTYRFVTGDSAVYIKDIGDGLFSVSCCMEEWNLVWRKYFDFDRCYSDIFGREYKKHPFVDEAMEYGRGLRILRQDPWEMLVTFIISQRKSIPAIATAVETISAQYGHCIPTELEMLKSFPTPQELGAISKEDLEKCKLGYRASYVHDAIQEVLSGAVDLQSLYEEEDDYILESLQKVYGVGKKVANCVSLFAYGRTSCVPVDVWIARAIEEECGGESPFHLFGENAGIIQQYIFYYEKNYVKNH